MIQKIAEEDIIERIVEGGNVVWISKTQREFYAKFVDISSEADT